MKVRVCLLGIVTLLVTACGGGPDAPGDAEPVAEEPATATESAEQDEGQQDEVDPASDEEDDSTAPEEADDAEAEDAAPDDAEEEATGTEDGDDTGEDAGNRLAAALASVSETMGDDGVDDHCEPLSAWTEVEATLAEHLEDGTRQDGGLEARSGELVQFGCGFGWYAEGEGFGSLAVLVSVYATPVELPPDFEETSTPAGLSAHNGQGELEDDLVWMSGGPVSAAVTVAGGHELRVTALPDALAPEELLGILDAAWEDLG